MQDGNRSRKGLLADVLRKATEEESLSVFGSASATALRALLLKTGGPARWLDDPGALERGLCDIYGVVGRVLYRMVVEAALKEASEFGDGVREEALRELEPFRNYMIRGGESW